MKLQVHPAGERARIRYAERNAASIPLAAPDRNYQDPPLKPELIYALTRFEGMAGSHLPWLDQMAVNPEVTRTPFQSLRSTVTQLLGTNTALVLAQPRSGTVWSSSAKPLQRLSRALITRTPAAVRRNSRENVARESLRVFAQTQALIERYPEDAGVLVTLLLNHVVLRGG
jgi:mannose-6-phosphate isomerase